MSDAEGTFHLDPVDGRQYVVGERLPTELMVGRGLGIAVTAQVRRPGEATVQTLGDRLPDPGVEARGVGQEDVCSSPVGSEWVYGDRDIVAGAKLEVHPSILPSSTAGATASSPLSTPSSSSRRRVTWVSGSMVRRPSVRTSVRRSGGTIAADPVVAERSPTSRAWTNGTQAIRSARADRTVAARRLMARARSAEPSWAITANTPVGPMTTHAPPIEAALTCGGKASMHAVMSCCSDRLVHTV